MDKINIYGPTDILVLSINVDDTSYRYKAIMAENSLNLKFSLPEYIQIEVDSYVDYKAERYFLFEEQTFVKNNTRNFEYNLTLLTHEALLRTKQFKFFLSDELGNTIPPLKVKGSFTGKPLDFLNLIVRNMNDGDTGWVVGSYIEGEQKTLSFNQITCAEFLKQVCDEYKTEYDVVLKTINMGKVEKDKANPLSLSYGKGNGLKSGVKRNNGEASKINRIYVQGGSTNIDKSKYRISNMVGSDILKIPANASKVYNGVTYVSDADGTYVQRSGLTERVREGSYENTDIFPQRIGTVSSVVAIDVSKNLYDIVDSSIPVDLNYNDYMIAGEVWTIIFQTGALAGQEFDLAKYYHVADETHAAYTFEIVPKEDAGIAMPSTTIIPAVGDKYIVFHISMPQSYITTAETSLFDKVVEVLYENEIADYAFDGELDPIYTKANWLAIGSKLNAGNFVSFTDPDFSTEPVIIRINGVREYVNKPYEPSIELNNKTSSKSISSKLKELDSDEVRIDNSKRESISYTKRRWRDAVETMTLLEDALKNFSAGINPIWVQTMSILVGEESLQFRFVDDKTTPESVNDSFVWSNITKVFGSSDAIIQHMTIGIKNLSSSHAAAEYLFWDIPAYTSPVMTDLDPFYIYLKCSKTSSAGVVLMSKTPFDLDPNDGFYYFLSATLGSEVEGERSLITTYGFTEITPGRITLDKILSPDGYQYWDMINNKFKIGNATEYLSYNENNDNLLKLVGTIEATSGLIAGWTIGVNTISKGNVILGADGSISNIIDGVTYWTFNPDGSGSVAKGNISWNAAGQASGAFTTLDNLGDFNVQGSIFASGAIVAGALNGTLPDDLPVSSPLLYGVSKYDDVTIKINANGQWYVATSGGTVVSFGTEVAGQSIQLIVAAITKTLALAGHTHNYQPLDNDLTAIAALTGTGLLKRTGTDTWALDTNAYLTAITKGMVEEVLTGNVTTHTHNQYLLASAYTAAEVLSKLLTVDGAGSGLDADLLRGVAPSNLAVLSATKLANTKTIWGQNFNGEGNVSGALSGATTGTFSSNISATTGIFSNLTANYISKHTAGGLANSLIYDNGTNVGIGRTDAEYKLDVNGSFRTTDAAYLNSTLSVAGHATFNSDIFIPRENAWAYIKNTSAFGGIKIGTGNASGTYVDAISITTGGNYVRSEIPFIANVTLSVTGASTLTGLLTANGGIGSTTGTFSSYLTANRFYTGYDCGLANAISCSNWFRSNGATGWLNATYTAGILSDTANIVRTYSTNKFKVYNTAIDSILTLGGVTAANVISSGAVVAGALNGTLPDDLPIATGSLFGVVKIDDVTIKIDANGKIYAIATGGVSSWNDLTDKPANLTALASLAGAGIARRNSDGTFTLDTSAYLTAITKAMVEAVLTGDIPTHGHSQYLTAITKAMVEAVLTGNITTHTHSQYLTAITKTMVEAVLTGNITTHTHSQYLTAITKTMVEAVLTGSITSHNHSGTYQPLDGDLTAIAALAGTGLLKRTGTDTWTFDTNTYLTAITKAMVENVLTGIITSHQHNYLPISGGTISRYISIDTPVSAGSSFVMFLRGGTPVGYVGDGASEANTSIDFYNYVSGKALSLGNDGKLRYGAYFVWDQANSNLKTVDWNAKNLYAVNGLFDGAVVAGALNGTSPDDLPVATTSLFGVVKTGASLNNNVGVVNLNGRHYTTTSTYTDAAVREITAELVLGTGNMTSGTLDQIQLAFAPLTTTRGLTGNIIATATGAGMSLTIGFRKDTGSGRWYLMIYNGTGATVVRDGILISIRGQQTI